MGYAGGAQRDRDPRLWAVVAGNVLYAERATRDEADRVLAEQRSLAVLFGLPVRVEPPIVTELKTP